jgi:hypothetical protein
MDRRIAVRDVEDTLQRQTWFLNPDRYDSLFFAGLIGPPVEERIPIEGEEIDQPVTDIDDIDAYFESLEKTRSVTGAQVIQTLGDNDGWV